MKRNNFLLKSILLCFAIALTHCSPKESQRNRMLPDGDYVVPEEQPLQTQNQAEASRLEVLINTADPLVAEQMLLSSDVVDANMLFDKVIVPLRDVALNVDYLIDPETRYIESEAGRLLVPRAVALFN
ncbi:MAG: hypothetical protein HRT44_06805, partial [Bdellovibrionales bacterium]|nr:hypothetical protein [Bdellovibrionales bacterium]NQZ18948.1 hypothetical protein [Bdellovibrionales bacterium]